MIYKQTIKLLLLLGFFISMASASRYSYWRDNSIQASSPSFWYSRRAESNYDIADCSDETYALQIKEFKVTPDFITPGAEVTIEASGVLKTDVTSGAMGQLTVKLGVVTLLRKTLDICEELGKKKDKVTLQCPLEKGELIVKETFKLPKEIPPGDFRISFEGYTAEDEDLICLRIHADLRKRPPPSSRWGRFFQLVEDDSY